MNKSILILMTLLIGLTLGNLAGGQSLLAEEKPKVPNPLPETDEEKPPPKEPAPTGDDKKDEGDKKEILIGKITVVGLTTVKEEEVRPLLSSIKEGKPYDSNQVDKAFKALLETGMFSTASKVDLVEEEDGTFTLIFTLVENPRFSGKVSFAGNLKLGKKHLEKILGLKKDKDFLGPSFLQKKLALLNLEYQLLGHYRPKISLMPAGIKDGYLVFKIIEGPKAFINRIQFRFVDEKGNPDPKPKFTRGELERQMQTKRRAMGGLWQAGVFRNEAFQEDIRTLESYMRSNGYLDAQVLSTRVILSPARSQLTVDIEIEKDKQYTVHAIKVVTKAKISSDILDGASIRNMLKLKAGKKGVEDKLGDPYNGAQLRTDLKKINLMIRDKGYPYALVNAELRYPGDKENQVDIVFIVTLDRRFPAKDNPAKIQISKVIPIGSGATGGGLETRLDVIKAEFAKDIEGNFYSQSKINQTIRNLEKTGLFYEIEPLPLEMTEAGKANLKLRLKENEPGRIGLTLGFSERSGLFGAFEIVHTNFDPFRMPKSWADFRDGKAWRGGGQYFRLLLSPGTDSSNALIEWENPRIQGSPWFVGGRIEYRQDQLNKWDEDWFIAGAHIGRRLGQHHKVSFALSYEHANLSNISSGAPVDAFDAKGHKDFVIPRFAWEWNTLNTTQEIPSKGHKVEVALEQALGDSSFLRFSSKASKFFPIYEQADGQTHIVMFGGSFDAITRDGGDNVPIYQRLFAGGVDTLRGFKYRGAGPHKNSEPVGGLVRVLFRTEYIFPIYRSGPPRVLGRPKKGYDVRGVLFTDVGWVGNQVGSLDNPRLRLLHPTTKSQGSGSPRGAFGFGLRMGLAKFSANIFLGMPVNAGSQDEKSIIGLSLGTNF